MDEAQSNNELRHDDSDNISISFMISFLISKMYVIFGITATHNYKFFVVFNSNTQNQPKFVNYTNFDIANTNFSTTGGKVLHYYTRETITSSIKVCIVLPKLI